MHNSRGERFWSCLFCHEENRIWTIFFQEVAVKLIMSWCCYMSNVFYCFIGSQGDTSNDYELCGGRFNRNPKNMPPTLILKTLGSTASGMGQPCRPVLRHPCWASVHTPQSPFTGCSKLCSYQQLHTGSPSYISFLHLNSYSASAERAESEPGPQEII